MGVVRSRIWYSGYPAGWGCESPSRNSKSKWQSEGGTATIEAWSLSENSFSVILNEAEGSEKSEKSSAYANEISRLRLEMTILGQATSFPNRSKGWSAGQMISSPLFCFGCQAWSGKADRDAQLEQEGLS